MAKTLKELGVRDYLDEVYAKEGGFAKLRKRMDDMDQKKITRQEVADEFRISRPHLNTIINMIKELEMRHGN